MLRRTCLVVAGVFLLSGAAEAASFSSLVSQGYEAGPLTKNRAGLLGWTVSKGGRSYFCRMKVSMAYDGRRGLVQFLASGRRLKVDRATWEASRGGPDPSLPQLADLEAGRVRPQDVGSCSAA